MMVSGSKPRNQDEAKRVMVSARLSPKTVEILDSLTEVLYAYGIIPEPKRTYALLFCIHYTAEQIKEEIVRRRSGHA